MSTFTLDFGFNLPKVEKYFRFFVRLKLAFINFKFKFNKGN